MPLTKKYLDDTISAPLIYSKNGNVYAVDQHGKSYEIKIVTIEEELKKENKHLKEVLNIYEEAMRDIELLASSEFAINRCLDVKLKMENIGRALKWKELYLL